MKEAVYHGGGIDAAVQQYGGKREQWLDLSTAINPHAYPVGDVSMEAWQRLPDTGAMNTLLDAARRYYNVPQDRGIIAANGSQALVELLPHILRARNVTIISPTYGEYAHVWQKHGAEITETGREGPVPENTDVLVVVNPNNPDTAIYEPERLQALARIMAEREGMLIVDEAFCDTMPDKSIVPVMPENVIVLRSFGKFFGLAGLRLGFAICSQAMAEKVTSVTGLWRVGGPALEVGKKALSDASWIMDMRERLFEDSRKQAEMLKQTGLEVCGVNPLYIHTRHPAALSVFTYLAERHILVRKFPERAEFLRFGLCAGDGELERLKNALEGAMANA